MVTYLMESASKPEVETFVRTVVEQYSRDKSKTIVILQAILSKFGYLSKTAISSVASDLRIPEIDVLGIATFYEQFRFTKPGKNIIKVCEGTACHVKGGALITEVIERELNIHAGETTSDGEYSLDRVACMGCCALAPVVVKNEEIFSNMDTSKLSKFLKKSSDLPS